MVNESKRILEEVVEALDVSLSHIDNYRLNGKISVHIGYTTDYDSGGVIESLSGEPKTFVCICVFYCIVNFCLNSQSKAL